MVARVFQPAHTSTEACIELCLPRASGSRTSGSSWRLGIEYWSILLSIRQFRCRQAGRRLVEGSRVGSGGPSARFKQPGDHIVKGVHQAQLEVSLDLRWNVDQVFLIVPGQEHGLDAGTTCGQDFLAHASYREHTTGERDLAGHREVGLDRFIAKQADECGGDGHSSGRTILGNGAGRDMDVQVGLGEPRRVERQRLGVAAK